ncbi:hypothetical protein PR048_003945 [Dryococelus australis]|uniref:Uncharacterized protein n=1 Tax=Dryococelus australis TaxID=614101 RepID=A0ABQ9I458_9NEOP|nr:hypothetical protein PR048_003945 [Dryococelus australis]
MDAEENSNWSKRKKRNERKEHIVKKLKVAGKEHISHGGKRVDPRTTGPDGRLANGKLMMVLPMKVAGKEHISHGGKRVDPRTTGPDGRLANGKLMMVLPMKVAGKEHISHGAKRVDPRTTSPDGRLANGKLMMVLPMKVAGKEHISHGGKRVDPRTTSPDGRLANGKLMMVLPMKVAGKEHISHGGKRVDPRTTSPDGRLANGKLMMVLPMKVAGKEHISHGGKRVDPRTTGPDGRLANAKKEQDFYLSSRISLRLIARRRPRKPVFVYKVRINVKDCPVCRQAFIGLHGITKDRVYNIQQSLLTSGKSPKDQRDKRGNRPMKYHSAIHDIIRKYLPESLTISNMHEMFLNTYHIIVPYKVYWSTFIQEFNIKFRFPRSDTCSICDTLAIKINNPECCTEKRKKLETELKYFVDKLGLVILCENKCRFYSHRLWRNMFCVHDLGSDGVTMFTYHEGDGRKGRNKLTSMLLTYINHNNETVDLHQPQ